LEGLEISKNTINELFSIKKKEWLKETKDIEQFYNKFGDKLPKELWDEFKGLTKRLE